MKLPGWVQFGGAKARGTRRHGDVIVSYQYVNDEPALVLWPARPGARSGAYVVCLSSAFKYVEDDYLIAQSFKACEVMGLFSTKQQVYRIATAIQDNIEELVRMKPEPEDEKKSVGEGRLIANGKTIDFEMLH